VNESIYAPPEADIAVNPDADGGYYVVSPGKFLILTILTAGLYLAYWFYRQWRMVKARDESRIWPVPRGIFYLFFTHSLYADINDTLERRQVDFAWRHGATATRVVIVYLLSSVSGWMSTRSIGSPVSDILSLALLPVLAFVALPAQKAANIASGDAPGAGNRRLTVANWAWMILGGLALLLSFVNLYLVVAHPELFVEP
jgi:hypothetical protein